MRIPCPHCGMRGSEEFSYRGAAGPPPPAADAPAASWHDHVYLRDNPFGPHRELWHHRYGCRRWLVVTRDTRTHDIAGAVDASAWQPPA